MNFDEIKGQYFKILFEFSTYWFSLTFDNFHAPNPEAAFMPYLTEDLFQVLEVSIFKLKKDGFENFPSGYLENLFVGASFNILKDKFLGKFDLDFLVESLKKTSVVHYKLGILNNNVVSQQLFNNHLDELTLGLAIFCLVWREWISDFMECYQHLFDNTTLH